MSALDLPFALGLTPNLTVTPKDLRKICFRSSTSCHRTPCFPTGQYVVDGEVHRLGGLELLAS